MKLEFLVESLTMMCGTTLRTHICKSIPHCVSESSVFTIFSLKIRHNLVSLGIGMNKMAEGDEYLNYLDKTLGQAAKPWSASIGVLLKTK